MTEKLLRATVTQRGVVFGPGDEVLVLQRTSDGGWELPGGRVGQDERAIRGLRRELVEETSLSPEIVTPVHTLVWRNDENKGRFAVYYYCRSSTRTVSLSSEHATFEWKSLNAIPEYLSTPQQTAVELAAEEHEAISF